jgi:hypothetical protein
MPSLRDSLTLGPLYFIECSPLLLCFLLPGETPLLQRERPDRNADALSCRIVRFQTVCFFAIHEQKCYLRTKIRKGTARHDLAGTAEFTPTAPAIERALCELYNIRENSSIFGTLLSLQRDYA